MIMGALIAWIFFPIAFFISSICCAADSDYAYPRILISGTTGVGKSSLSSVLAGCPPGDCLFPVCTSINSCTKNTSIVQAKFMGNFSGPDVSMKVGNVTIVDTPAFEGDSEEPKLLSEMVQVLKEDLKWANLIVLCFDGIRFDANTKAMLQTLDKLFGQNLWKNALIEVTKWSYNEQNIQDRKRRGITEEDTLLAINNQLKQKFNLSHSLPGVFLDSFAVHFPEDEVQTSFFRKYSSILWETALDRKPFSLEALGQVKDGRTSACGIDIDCCDSLTSEIDLIKLMLEMITDKIDTNKNNIASNANNIDSNADKIDTNIYNIATNAGNIASSAAQIMTNIDDIAINAGHIMTNTDDIATNTGLITTNTDKIIINTDNIATNTGHIMTNTDNIAINTGHVSTNTGHITTNTDNIKTNTDNIKTNTDNIVTNTGHISTNTGHITTNTGKISTNTDDISELTETTSRFVSYCGFKQYTYTDGIGTLTYSRLVTSVNSFSRGGLSTSTGIFTAPTDGTYLITANFYTVNSGDFEVYINYNGHDLAYEGYIYSSSTDNDHDMTGRTLTKQLKTNDKLYLHVANNPYYISFATFCITLLH